MISTFQISEENLEWFKEYIDKINKKAVKLGKRQVAYNILSEEFVSYFNQEAEMTLTTKAFNVEVDAEPIKIEGYTFVAVIDHAYENGNVIRNRSGIELPKEYETIDGKCEHCNTNRRRKTTVILQDKDGRFIQVGKSCLKDYLGYDVSNHLTYSDLITSMELQLSKLNTFGGSGFVKYIKLTDYLVHVEESIAKRGWVSKSNAENPMDSTSYRANADMELTYMKSKLIVPTEKVLNAIEWIRTTEKGNNEYMTNLQTICANDFVRVNDLGFVASLMVAYEKHLEVERKKLLEQQNKGNSQYVGKIGERREFDVYVEKIHSFDTMYGTSYIIIMRDDDGNVIVWKGSSYPKTDSEDRAKLKGTIKEHTEYDNIKQTIITRCRQ